MTEHINDSSSIVFDLLQGRGAILLLPNKAIADYFIKELYTYSMSYLIVTTDGSYPFDKSIRKSVWHEIETNKKLIILIIGNIDTNKITIKTSSVMVLNKFLEIDLIYNDERWPSQIYKEKIKYNFTKEKFLNFINDLFIVLDERSRKDFNNRKYNHLTSLTRLKKFEYELNLINNTIEYNWKHILLSHIDNPVEYKCKTISFKQIQQGWGRLWPNRTANPTNPWDLTENYSIQEQGAILGDPTFFGVYDGDKLIGVNSGYKTSDINYRSRGLWVNEDYRRRKVSSLLLYNTIKKAEQEGAATIWTCPKEESVKAYESSGFNIVSKRLGPPLFQWGVNYIAIKSLNRKENDEKTSINF
tara:strand:+ start:1421 stop:2494 length:1074 start_codon:yes stop_codon:yes gene_type:complete